MSDTKLRTANIEDSHDLGKIYAMAFNTAYEDENWSDDNAIKFIEGWLEAQPDLFFVIETAGRIVGGIVGKVMTVDVGPSLTDVEIFVDPEHHGRGAGKKLLRRILKAARDKYKIKAVSFTGDKRKEYPFEWYKKIGMHETGWVFMWGHPEELLNNLGGEE